MFALAWGSQGKLKDDGIHERKSSEIAREKGEGTVGLPELRGW